MDKARCEKLSLWMFSHNISLTALGKELGITPQSVRKLLDNNRISTDRHEELVLLGFPVELLPPPLNVPRGRRPQVPHFPGLDKDNHNKKEESSNA